MCRTGREGMKNLFPSFKVEKKLLFSVFFVLCAGGLTGSLFALLSGRAEAVTVPSLHQLAVSVSTRSLRQLLLTDVLFSLLLLFCTVFFRRSCLQLVLFFLKGFFISYLCVLFVYYFHARGFLFAAAVLFFHSFLLLPLQIVSVIAPAVRPTPQQRKRSLRAYCSLSFAAVFVCALLEQTALPWILHF